jgi:CheY-like chemotaxis protein
VPINSVILLVEDSDDDASLLERVLRNAGIANPVRRMSNGADALAFLAAKEQLTDDPLPLGIILLDLKLPDQSGFEILKLMRGRSFYSEILKVMITSVGDMDNIRRAYALGADSFVTKPVTQTDLQELIRSFPDPWVMVDIAAPTATRGFSETESNSYDRAAHVWSANQQIIQTLRENLRSLRKQLSDTEETFAIIETLTEELRIELGPPNLDPKRKRRPNLLL